MTGASDAGLAGIMVGQASVADSYTYYSRTQEASADQKAIKKEILSILTTLYLL